MSTPTTPLDLLDTVRQALPPVRTTVDSGGVERFHATCPNCLKEPNDKTSRSQDSHFRYSVFGGKCFVCGYGVRLVDLAERVVGGIIDGASVNWRAIPTPEDPSPAWWLSMRPAMLGRYTSRERRFAAWKQYRPTLDRATIERWSLGIGRLPTREPGDVMATERLVIPIWQDGELVNFAGRRLVGRGPKWLTAPNAPSTKWLFGLDHARQRLEAGDASVVYVVENKADAVVFMALFPDLVAVSPSTVSSLVAWDDWATALRPATAVVVAYDFDMVGLASDDPRRVAMVDEWRAGAPDDATPPPSWGELTVARLKANGLRAAMFDAWPDGTPRKSSLVDLLTS